MPRSAAPVPVGLLGVILTVGGSPALASPDAADWSEAVIEPLERAAAAFSTGLRERLARMGAAGLDLDLLWSTLAAAGWPPAKLLAGIVAVVAAGLAAHWATARALGAATRRRDTSIVRAAVSAVAALGVGLVVAYLVAGEAEAARRTFRTWAFVIPLAALASTLIGATIVAASPAARRKRLAPLANGLAAAVAWALGGIAVLRTLAAWGAGSGLQDLVGTAFVALPTAGLMITAYAGSRRPLAATLAGPRPRSRRRRFLARRWPAIAVGIVVVTVVVLQVATTLGRPLPSLATLVTLILALMWPHVDGLIVVWAERGFRAETVSAASVAARRTTRLALAALIGAALAAMWGAPAASGLGIQLGTLVRVTLGITAVALATAYLWNLVGVASDRLLSEERAAQGGHHADEEADPAPHTRLGTILPLVVGASKAGLATLAVLSILLAVGINVWPLVTGLSVFGLAIGFGSQSLVKDVVSGLFFLADDAFRLGEYIETVGAKGRVEKISIRSVSLRHPRGALATIPYGQIGKVQNYSCDWVIEKLAFRVAFDTDVDKVRKIFKQIGQDIADNPDLKPDILETFKSQGIASVDEGTLVIRGKFKARAGHQFAIRKATLAAVQQAFQTNGISAIARPIVTYAPQNQDK
ncbi:mechanosensitive ion channel family protein [Methylobacterium frigidaeris]|uniref:Mechanosensitive ion channel protein MscS n=1 Tax=Methylobacterium frigidaeris TaxID=2038277 RepID=A0AA37HH71_9HYPH|nr:mechanosensitive ion channel family protein [Methylobacterium frigidaeris]GJD65702.1 hypothetical protein MPEAHAMD_5897 [Methylobacterium frigidaeris]